MVWMNGNAVLRRNAIRLAALAFWVMPGSAATALAQPTDMQEAEAALMLGGVPVTEGRFNAALRYYALWSTGADLFDSDLPDRFNLRNDTWVPDDETAAWLVSNSETISGIVEATRLQRCDFGIPFEEGVGALLPHLGTMRTTARILIADARRLRASGDLRGAASRAAAAIRLGQHAAQDRIIISSLVGTAIASLAEGEATRLADASGVSREDATELIEAINGFLGDDPAGLYAALRGERDVFGGWLKANFRGEDAGERLDELGFFASSDELRHAFRDMNAGMVDVLYAQLDRAYEELSTAAQADDSAGALREFEKQLDRGRYGMLAQIMVPAIQKAHHSVTDLTTRLNALKSKLLIEIG